MRELELEALLFENALELLGDLAIHARQDAVEIFDHRDLGAEAAPDRAEFEADDAGADDDQFLRRRGKRERAGGGNNHLLVDIDARQARDIRAGRDYDMFGRMRDLAVRALDRDFAGRGDPRLALKPVNLVLLQQEGDAGDIGGNRVVLVLHHRAHVERGLADDDAERGHAMPRLVEHFRGVQQGLGGDAADVEAGAAQRRALLDHGDLHAELRRADRADIAAGTGADNDDVISHASSPVVGRARRERSNQ